MNALNEAQINIIKQDLADQGLNLHVLKDEILDHICCLVENKLNEGIKFREAKKQVYSEFNQEELLKTQKQTRRIARTHQIKKKFKSVTSVAAVFMLLLVVGADAQDRPQGMPVEGDGNVTSSYGERTDPIYKTKRFHQGVDIKAKEGTPVKATADGVVITAEFDVKWGHYVVLEHVNGFQTKYGHLSELNVKKGDVVTKGVIIALSGSTGYSTGPHLHYEIIKDGEHVDPSKFMK